MKKVLEAIYNKKSRYIAVGAFNTLAGYFISLGVYFLIGPRAHILIVGIVVNFFAITTSFLTYKLFVFQTKSNWSKEYLKSFIAYGFSAILGIIVLWGLVDGAQLPFWFAQAVAIVLVALFSYFANTRFTFRDSNLRKN